MKTVLLSAFLLIFSVALYGQAFVANYDEAKMPAYTLPDPLLFNNGQPVEDAAGWTKRRAEILELFENEVYGKTPAGKVHLASRVISENKDALEGLAIQREVQLTLEKDGNTLLINVLFYLPKAGKKHPLFLGLNFSGNHTISDDPGIAITNSWVRNNAAKGITANKSVESTRGSDSDSWPVRALVERGYGLATIYCGDLDPDFDDGFQNGVHSLFPMPRSSNSWGTVAGWAWGLSRAMDYLEKVKEVDSKKVVVLGHSRLGKASLWAGANDPRFAIVVSNESGCGGAALSKRIFGETVERINTSFPHWFCENFRKYNRKEENLPVDQHELLALIAPRPLYVCSAEEDQWSDPKGEFLACAGASPVYKLLGKEGLPGKDFPDLQRPMAGTIGYHIRSGKHAINLYDWTSFMNFSDIFFTKR
jgi:hypothetical protein